MQFKPQAYKTLSNSHGMEIMINETSEQVSYRYSDDLPGDLIATTQIDYDQDGDPYFTEYHLDNSTTIHYLSEFIRMKI